MFTPKYYQADQTKVIDAGRPCGSHVRREKMYRVLVRNPGKRQLGRRGRRWEDEIRMDLREIGWSII
jgi:hypothetical protein